MGERKEKHEKGNETGEGKMLKERKERGGAEYKGERGVDEAHASIFPSDPAHLARGWSGKPNSGAWIGRLFSGRGK